MIAARLLHNELLKMFKSLAFWVPALATVGIQVLINGTRYYEAIKNPERTFALPDAWRVILTEGVEAGFVFGTGALVLLISNEFTWRTARQSVIDGLSKEQFFGGKVLLLLVLAAVFAFGQIALSGVFPLVGTDFSTLTGPLVNLTQLRLLAGNYVALVGYGAVALFVSMAVRSGGAAMGVWFFYWMMGEQLLGGIMRAISERIGEAAQFLPTNVFEQWTRYLQFDGAAFREAVVRAASEGRPPPSDPWDWTTLAVWSAIWLTLMIGGAFLWFRRRDL